ncbi:hypothetical protein SLA2020_171250 [Shorea laevis]
MFSFSFFFPGQPFVFFSPTAEDSRVSSERFYGSPTVQPSPSPVPPSVDPSLPPPPPPLDLLVTAQKLIPPAPDPLRQNGHSPDLPVKSFKDILVDGSSVMEPGTSSGHQNPFKNLRNSIELRDKRENPN